MAMLQSLTDKNFVSFDALGEVILKRIACIFKNNSNIISISLVFDRYVTRCPLKIARGVNVAMMLVHFKYWAVEKFQTIEDFGGTVTKNLLSPNLCVNI
jgi:hypothetical protein